MTILAEIFKRLQVFAIGFSVAAFGCMGASMLAGETSPVSMSVWMQDRALAYMDANPHIMGNYIARYVQQPSYAALPAPERELSSLEMLQERQRLQEAQADAAAD